MALVMARPWQDPKTGVWYLRQRTPADLAARVRGISVTLPIGDSFATTRIGLVVQVSLRTKDRQKAKELHAVADAALRRFWDGQRNGPTKLTTKQATALAGTLYATAERFEDRPGPATLWETIERDNALARQGGSGLASLLIGEEARVEHSREDRFGGWADLLLAREGLTVDATSRKTLVKAVQVAVEAVTAKMRAHADFDYSPDSAAARFPAWEPAKAEQRPCTAGKLTADDLFEAWSKFQAPNLAPNTIKRYAASFRSLAGFLKGRDVASLSTDDLHDWAEHRRDKKKISARSVNQNDLVAASSVFKWAMSREGGKRMTINPAKDVSLTEGARTRTREKTFRADEIAAILKAALATAPDPKNPTSAFARRWCPWLAAYSGARITELTSLLGTDVRMEGGVAVMDFRKTKTGMPRTVPIHGHLIEQGFMEFAASRGKLPLFYDLSRHGKDAVTDPAEMRSRKLAQWIRDTVNLDMAVQPDHGWRHTWKTIALGAHIPERISDAVTGHSVGKVARGYEHPPVEMLAEAMRRFPRYQIP